MKKVFSLSLFIFFISYSFGQDLNTLIKLHDVSVALGISTSISIDTTLLTKSKKARFNRKAAEQQLYLLKAAEYYQNKDYESSSYYISKVRINFKSADHNNLKYVIMIGCYARLKDIERTARAFYLGSNFIDPENMRIVREEIKRNFKKVLFDEALSDYFYLHKRKKIIDDIQFIE